MDQEEEKEVMIRWRWSKRWRAEETKRNLWISGRKVCLQRQKGMASYIEYDYITLFWLYFHFYFLHLYFLLIATSIFHVLFIMLPALKCDGHVSKSHCNKVYTIHCDKGINIGIFNMMVEI